MLLDKRIVYRPIEYQEADTFWLQQHQSHWLHTEVLMASDLTDWKFNLTDAERNLVGNILKAFTQAEVVVGDYWRNVPLWFPKPEIASMAAAFSDFETIHQRAYALLNETLGLDNFEAFLEDEDAKNKLELLMNVDNSSLKPEDIARSLAIFSAFTEGVSIFSSFAVLLSFQTRNLLKGVGQIVSWSIRDESLHSRAGCWLFNKFIEEYPHLNTKELKDSIELAAYQVVYLEKNFIHKAFEQGPIKCVNSNQAEFYLTVEHLEAFIHARINEKLKELNYNPLFDVNESLIKEMRWFDVLSSGKEHADFFATRVTSYAKGSVDFDDIFN